MDGDETLCMHYFYISKTRNWRMLHLVTGSVFFCVKGASVMCKKGSGY